MLSNFERSIYIPGKMSEAGRGLSSVEVLNCHPGIKEKKVKKPEGHEQEEQAELNI